MDLKYLTVPSGPTVSGLETFRGLNFLQRNQRNTKPPQISLTTTMAILA